MVRNSRRNLTDDGFVLEPLEARTFLSVTLDPTGLLTINGTDAADAIKLRPGHDHGSVIVKSSMPGDADADVDAKQYNNVNQLIILAGDGHDKIKLTGLFTDTHGGPLAITIDGQQGNDRIQGSAGPDTILGGPGNDRINARAGDDAITGGPGIDRLNGKRGNDTLNYDDAPTGINVNLSTATAPEDGHGHTDKRIKGFESLTGTPYADQLTNSKTNPATIDGNGGNDLIAKPLTQRASKTQTVLIGRVTDDTGATHLLTLTDQNHTDRLLDLTSSINEDGTFVVDQTQLEDFLTTKLKKGTTHKLTLHAEDIAGNTSNLTIPLTKAVEYALAISAPTPPDPDTPDTPTPGHPLPDGTYDITATATDLAGNTSDPSNTETILIDTKAPTIQAATVITPAYDVIDSGAYFRFNFGSAAIGAVGAELYIFYTDSFSLKLSPDSDTGLYNNDKITNDTTPHITIDTNTIYIDDTDDTIVMDITLNDVVIATVPHGDVELPLGTLTDGIHTVKATTRNASTGTQLNESNTLTFTIDTIPPATPSAHIATTTDTGRSNTDGVTKRATPRFTLEGDTDSYISVFAKRTALERTQRNRSAFGAC